jgi:predicted GNAT superfamily acetyltransferase
MHNPISIREIRGGDLEAVRRINAESSPGVSLLTRHGLERLTAGATAAWVVAAGQDIAAYLIGFAGEARQGSVLKYFCISIGYDVKIDHF